MVMIRRAVVLLVILALLALPAGAAAGSSGGSSLQATLQPLIEAKMKELRVPRGGSLRPGAGQGNLGCGPGDRRSGDQGPNEA